MTTPKPAIDFDSPAELREALRISIGLGDFAPGAKLTERELTQRFNVGRTAIREALRYLAAEGIVELTDNRGARVSTITYSEALHLFQVRAALEGLAGELFATRGTADQKIEFAQSLRPLHDAMLQGDITQTLRLSDIYYGHLLRGANNPELQRITELLHVRIIQVRRISLSIPELSEQTVDGLKRIINAVLLGDPEEARLACISLVHHSAQATLPLLATLEVAGE
jgi:DNA-binding GntR family transcriptional regulator